MSKPEWGIKRTCPSCYSVFYDMMKDPIICPKCNSIYDTQALLNATKTETKNHKNESNEDSSDSFLFHEEDEEVFLDDQEDFLENLEELDSDFEPKELGHSTTKS